MQLVMVVLAHRYAQGNEGSSQPSAQVPLGGASLFCRDSMRLADPVGQPIDSAINTHTHTHTRARARARTHARTHAHTHKHTHTPGTKTGPPERRARAPVWNSGVPGSTADGLSIRDTYTQQPANVLAMGIWSMRVLADASCSDFPEGVTSPHPWTPLGVSSNPLVLSDARVNETSEATSTPADIMRLWISVDWPRTFARHIARTHAPTHAHTSANPRSCCPARGLGVPRSNLDGGLRSIREPGRELGKQSNVPREPGLQAPDSTLLRECGLGGKINPVRELVREPGGASGAKAGERYGTPVRNRGCGQWHPRFSSCTILIHFGTAVCDGGTAGAVEWRGARPTPPVPHYRNAVGHVKRPRSFLASADRQKQEHAAKHWPGEECLLGYRTNSEWSASPPPPPQPTNQPTAPNPRHPRQPKNRPKQWSTQHPIAGRCWSYRTGGDPQGKPYPRGGAVPL